MKIHAVPLLVFSMVFTGFITWSPSAAYAAVGSIQSSNGNYTLEYDGRAVQVNGTPIEMAWLRQDTSESSTITLVHDQSATIYGNVLSAQYGSYYSKYTGYVPHAFKVRVETILYWINNFMFDNIGGSYIHNSTDVYGFVTSRQTTIIDPPLYFIIDADSNKVVDFDSSLNYFYYQNAEPHSFSAETASIQNGIDSGYGIYRSNSFEKRKRQ